MAEVSLSAIHLHGDDDDHPHHRDDVIVTLDSFPYWSPDFDSFDGFSSDPDFPPSDIPLTFAPQFSTARSLDDVVSEPDSMATVDLFDRENQVSFVMDLFHQRVEQSAGFLSQEPNLDSSFPALEGNDEMASAHLELDLGLGLGLGFCMDEHGLGDDDNSSFMVADRGDEFFMSRRGSVSETGESSTASIAYRLAADLRVLDNELGSNEDENEILGIDLNSEEDRGLDNTGDDDDRSLRLCLDSFHLEDQRDLDEDFEWEEVDGRVDEREVLSMFFDADVDEDLDVSVSVIPPQDRVDAERVSGMRNLEWEVLLNVHNLEGNVDFNLANEDGYNYTAEYEMLVGHFAENDNATVGRPPASKTVVKNLQLVALTQEDVDKDNAICAVCKDEMTTGQQAMQLPCTHRYHGDCIIPWLGIRNTCPVCRYELPTDDPDYEQRRAQRAGRAQ